MARSAPEDEYPCERGEHVPIGDELLAAGAPVDEQLDQLTAARRVVPFGVVEPERLHLVGVHRGQVRHDRPDLRRAVAFARPTQGLLLTRRCQSGHGAGG